MKSVALTEGKKAYFYDLNRQPGIKRNFSPKMRHAAGLQQAAWAAGMAECWAWGRSWLQRGSACGCRGQVCRGTHLPTPAGQRDTSAQDICMELLKETLQTGWSCAQICLQLWTLPLWELFLSSSVAWLPICPSFPWFCSFFRFSPLTSTPLPSSPLPGPCLPVLALLSLSSSALLPLMDIT